MEKVALEIGAVTPFQFGATTGSSAVDALSLLLHHVTEAISALQSSIPRKSKTDIVGRFPSLLIHNIFRDFNNTDGANLTNIFGNYFLPDYITEWVANLNSNWKLFFSFESNMKRPKPYRSGLLQGSPISLILFLIYA